jgi:aryl-alcohol dehydrogenase-like predicted oxidoreductase
MWNLKDRSFERDIIPMARSEGLALAPWSVVGGGRFRTDADEERRKETGEKGREMGGPGWERTEEEKKVCKALEEVSKEVGVEQITSGVWGTMHNRNVFHR